MWTKSAELRQWTPDWSGWLGRLTETISPAWLWILILWFALVATPIVLRGFHYEEGTVIALARGAIEDGHWLAPHQYGLRFVERPALMSWLMALLGLLFGGIDQWVARILPTLSLLGGAALIFHLVRQRVSATAAVFGAFCFMLSPGLLQKSVTAEADAMLSVILFAAFVLWWDGKRSGRISAWRWFAIGLVLGCAALTKGPQPVAYFSFGIGAFIVVRRQWADLPGFILGQALAGACVGLWYLAVYTPGDLELWAAQGRLNSRLGAIEWLTGFGHYAAQVGLENLPGILLAAPLGFAALRQRKQNPDDLVLALLCYAAMCTIFIGLLPGRGPRYAMPASLAIAALAGIAYDALRQQRAILLVPRPVLWTQV